MTKATVAIVATIDGLCVGALGGIVAAHYFRALSSPFFLILAGAILTLISTMSVAVTAIVEGIQRYRALTHRE